MADQKISQLAGATTPLAGTETLPVVQSGTTKKVSVANLTAGRTISATPLTWASLYDGIAVKSENSSLFGFYDGSEQIVGVIQGAYVNSSFQFVRSQSTQPVGRAYIYNGNFYIARANSGAVGSAVTETNVLTTDASANVKIDTGNLVQGTAAKGVNFTANTPAAGMTSQLLNWYEEGTWTPNVTAGSGTITSYTSSGNYTRVGNTITIFAKINITNAGTAGGNLNFSDLPYTSKNVGSYITTVLAREDNVTGSNFNVVFAGNNTTGIILSANWTNGVLYLFSATYLLA